MLRLYFSNRFEFLRERLFEVLATAPADPFVAEQIIVPGTAVRRRLEMDYADRFGICAQVRFGYLAEWVWRQIALVIDVPEASPFDAERLSWRIFRAFGDAELVAPHPRLSSYLGKSDPVMRYDFAQRLARQLEQYITYRPDWLEAWTQDRLVLGGPTERESAPDEVWQAALWRHLTQELAIGPEHPSARFLRRLGAPGNGPVPGIGQLSPAALFCLPTIPPLYLDILARVAERVDLSLYVMSPCREYWHDLVDTKRLARLKATGRLDYQEVGHRLLAGWGRQTQAFLALLHERTEGRGLEQEDYVPSRRNSLLDALQDEILTLSRASGPAVSDSDRSLEIHVCHSLTRELEVLHDQLLDMLAGPGDLAPADILIVMPRLEEAATLIHAVFGTVPDERHIPYAVTGLPRAEVNPAAAALIALLALLHSRFKASAVFDLLRRPLVSARFGLDEEALERIREWIVQSGIRWGLDGEQRAALGLPDSDRNSLRDGLDRLFLGYAAPQRSAPLAGRLPAGDVEGAAAQVLGIFDDYIAALEAARRESLDPANADAWRQRLERWIEALLPVDSQSIHDITEVRRAITSLCDDLASSAPQELLSLDVISAALTERLEDPARGALPCGSVTFAGMTPLRGLPYRVICVLGLNDGTFPVVARPEEFDLLAVAPRLGDRQRRDDDRNVFLDLVLAARDRLYLSYTGCSIRDNSALTPSILLAELLDHASALLAGAGASDQDLDAARRRLIVHHPLQAFSRAYFSAADGTDARLFSYATEYLPSVAGTPETRSGRPVPPEPDTEEDDDEGAREIGAPFFVRPLPWPEESLRELSLDDLKRFLRNPCGYLLQHRLDLTLRESDEELADDEPFEPEYGQVAVLAERLLLELRAGASAADVAALAAAATEYPDGAYGDALRDLELPRMLSFGQAVVHLTREEPLPPVAARLELAIGDELWILHGSLHDLRSSGLVRWRYDDTRPFDYLNGWLDHLLLSAVAPAGAAQQTLWQSRNGCYRLQPCDTAQACLAALVAAFRDGLSEPFRFFPKSAWAYVEALPKGRDVALAAARKRWRPNHEGRGESTGAAYRLALRGLDDPLDETFEHAAATVFGPLRDHLDDERLR